jgi:hypothetical protein
VARSDLRSDHFFAQLDEVLSITLRKEIFASGYRKEQADKNERASPRKASAS